MWIFISALKNKQFSTSSFDYCIVVYVSNSGQGAALTNAYSDVQAPQGWLIQVSPNRTNSIKAGDSQAFNITIQTESYIPYIGAAVLILVAAGLFFIYRKYGRR